MKRNVFVWMAATALTLSLTSPVAAAGRWGGARNYMNVNNGAKNNVNVNGGIARNYVDKDGDGICDYFVDANKDGVCDHCTWTTGRGMGCGRFFVDEDGDGVCDNYPNRGMGMGRGRRGRLTF